ncbi:MAG: hypothetical protein JXR25_07025 [Pontiellaceae bacterium]|nr:hypothetical protein [Pontiellaceae bacterium]MBN2784563.1 hypothetical protein [Pontiellaceae bacterium]
MYNKDQTKLVACPEGIEGSIRIPKTVATLPFDSFSGCPHLAAFEVDPENQHYSSLDGVLFDKGMTRLIKYPTTKAGLFMGCTNLTNVVFEAAPIYFDQGSLFRPPPVQY